MQRHKSIDIVNDKICIIIFYNLFKRQVCMSQKLVYFFRNIDGDGDRNQDKQRKEKRTQVLF